MAQNFSKQEVMTIIGCLLIELTMNKNRQYSYSFLTELENWYLKMITLDSDWYLYNCSHDLDIIAQYKDAIELPNEHLPKPTRFMFWGEHSKMGATLQVIQYLEKKCEKFPQFRLNVGMGVLRTQELLNSKRKES